jgi:hypothetical protein
LRQRVVAELPTRYRETTATTQGVLVVLRWHRIGLLPLGVLHVVAVPIIPRAV